MKPKTLHGFGTRFFKYVGAYCHTLLLLALLFFPSFAFAIDSGGAIFQQRWFSLYEEDSANGKSAGKTLTYDANASLEMWQNLYGYGQLRGLAEWLNVDGENRLDRAYIELGDYPLIDDILLTARLGDKEFLYSPLIEPYVRYRGGTLTLNTLNWSWTVFGGQTRRSIGVFGFTSPYAKQMVIGTRGKYNLGPLTLGVGVLGVEGSQLDTSPREKTTTTLTWDAEWRITHWLRWLAEADLSFYDLQDDHKGYRRDYALLFGPVIKYPATFNQPSILNLEILYKRIGPFTTSVSENVNSDKEGIFIILDSRPFKFLNFFGGFQGYREDLNHIKEIVAAQDVLGRAGVRLIGGGVWPTVMASYDFIQRRTTEKSDHPFYTEQAIYNFEISQYLAGLRYSLRYQRNELKDLVDSSAGFRTETFYADLRRLWGRNFETYFSGQWQRLFDHEDFVVQRYYYGRIGVLYKILGMADLRAEAAYTRTYRYNRTTADSIEDRGEALAGLVFYLPWNMSFNVDYTFRRILTHTGKGQGLDVKSASQSQVNFRLTKRYAWGKPEVAHGVAVPGLAPPGMAVPWGTLYGYVFVDINGNKKMDPGESGLGGMRITLEDGTSIITDSKGYYEIPRVVIGEHMLSLDLRRLPANYDPISSTKQKVEVQKRLKTEIDFAVGSLGSIVGRVIEDENANGKIDEDEKGLAGIGIILERESEKRVVYSDAAGDFIFDNVLGGIYKLYLDKTTLPERSKLTSTETLEVNLAAGTEQRGLSFLIYIAPRPVIKTFTGNGNGAPHPAPSAPKTAPLPPKTAPQIAPPKPGTSPAPSPVRPQTKGNYIVHIASFKNQKNAENLAVNLQKKGYKTKVVGVDLGKKGYWYRVVMDGYTSKKEAERAAENLRKKESGLSPEVLTGKE